MPKDETRGSKVCAWASDLQATAVTSNPDSITASSSVRLQARLRFRIHSHFCRKLQVPQSVVVVRTVRMDARMHAHQKIHLSYGILDNPISTAPFHVAPRRCGRELTPACFCPSPTKLNFDEFTLHSGLVARLIDQGSTPATCQPAPSMLLIPLRQMASATLRGFGRWHGLSTPNMNEAKSQRGAGSPPTN